MAPWKLQCLVKVIHGWVDHSQAQIILDPRHQNNTFVSLIFSGVKCIGLYACYSVFHGSHGSGKTGKIKEFE